MKAMMMEWWRLALVGVLLALLGLLVVLPWGRRRGTRLYRFRMSLWTRVMTLVPAAAIIMSTQSGCEDKQERSSCYITVDKDAVYDTSTDGDVNTADQNEVDQIIQCYARPMDVEPEMDAVQDSNDGSSVEPDAIMCYAAPEPEIIMCYADVGSTGPDADVDSDSSDAVDNSDGADSSDAVDTSDGGPKAD